MPAELLTEEEDPEDTRPVSGYFGKLPTTGDFVSRGLPDGFRRSWDAWLTRWIAPLQRDGSTFPPGGLRFRLVSGSRLAAGVILPSEDSAGRLFPFSLLLIADGNLSQPGIDSWCDAALALPTLATSPDDLWLALDALAIPLPDGPATGALQLWSAGHLPTAANADDPGNVLRQLIEAP